MDKFKTILLLLLLFTFAVIAAFYFENTYRLLVRRFFNLFQGNKIRFVGKDFHLFASISFVVAFGLFSIISALLLSAIEKTKRIFLFCLGVVFFSLATITTALCNSTIYVAECIACQDGVRQLHYNAVNYDLHFITSLVAGLMPLSFVSLKKQMKARIKDNYSKQV